MSSTLIAPIINTNRLARIAAPWLRYSVQSWFIAAFIGQWIFAVFLMLLYALPVLSNQPELSRLTQSIIGYVVGDSWGNALFFLHVVPAILLSAGGILQLWPRLRQKYPQFHRWNGRLFLILAFSGAVTGLALAWIRGSRISDLSVLGTTINGILIPIAVWFCYRAIRQGRVSLHQRWAVQTFFLVNGVWTFRLWLMIYALFNNVLGGGPFKLDDPQVVFISITCYLAPMVVAELYFWVKRNPILKFQLAAAAICSVGAFITFAGVLAATFLMWLPPIQAILNN